MKYSREYYLNKMLDEYIAKEEIKSLRSKDAIINMLADQGKISDNELAKYYLSEDPNYSPKLKRDEVTKKD